jgi:hypothetical protein
MGAEHKFELDQINHLDTDFSNLHVSHSTGEGENEITTRQNEITSSNKKDILGEDKGTVRNFAQFEVHLPEDYRVNNDYAHARRFIVGYFAVQVKRAEGQEVIAKRKLVSLRKKKGFDEFVDANQPLLAAIDIAVTGNNFQKDDETYDPVKPSFKIKKPKS